MQADSDLIHAYSSRTGFACMVIMFCLLNLSCKPDPASASGQSDDPKSEVLIKRRTDGTLSSLNQIDKNRIVHGLRVTYYSDGKTVYSKLTLNHGIKNGPSIRYYKNGQIFEHTGYKDGKKHGLTRKYYRNGNLMAEFEFENGIRLPGLKEYDKNRILVTDYPEILFKVEDHLDTWSRLDLIVYSIPEHSGIKYYLKQRSNGQESRIYLISDNGTALTQHFIKPGNTLHKKIEIIAEIPTELGNIMVRNLSYDLKASNLQ